MLQISKVLITTCKTITVIIKNKHEHNNTKSWRSAKERAKKPSVDHDAQTPQVCVTNKIILIIKNLIIPHVTK